MLLDVYRDKLKYNPKKKQWIIKDKFMSSQSDNNKRIAKNTLLLYFRMLLMMVVSLYTSRVILNALGVKDFGIYNVVCGVVMI